MAAAYGWMIFTDHLDDGTDDYSCAGVTGPRDIPADIETKLRGDLARVQAGTAARHGRAFRLYDDDGILYASGRIIDTTEGDWIMAPLDDYGIGGLGAVDIRYRDGNGPWVSI